MTIVSDDLLELAKRLAHLTGEDVDTAVARAVEERLSRLSPPPSKDREAVLRAFFDRVSAMPTKDDRPVEEVLGLGADGLPTR